MTPYPGGHLSPVRECRAGWRASRHGRAPIRRYPIRQMTTPVPVEGGVAGGALPMSAGTSPHGRRKPNGSACQRRTMAGVQDEAKHAMSDVAVEVLRGREAPAPAVDAEQGAGVGRRRGTGGAREAVHVKLEASWSPGPDERRPGRIVHDRDGRRDRDGPTTASLVTQVRRGAGRKP